MKKLIRYAVLLLAVSSIGGFVRAQQQNSLADPGIVGVVTVPSFLLGPNAQGVTSIQYLNGGFDPIPAGNLQITLSLNQYFRYVSVVSTPGFVVTSPDPITVQFTNTVAIPALTPGTLSVRVVATATTGTTSTPGTFQQRPYSASLEVLNPSLNGNLSPNNDNAGANIIVGDASIAPLAVNLTSFSATAVNCSALLQWKAEGENDLKHYEIEQSADGVNFTVLQKVQGRGGNANTYAVQAGGVGKKMHYRLAIVETTGVRKYSAIVPVQLDCDGNQYFSVYPNPVKKGQAITLQTSLTELVNYKLIDGSGKVVEMGKFQGRTDLSRPLVAGTYIVELTSGVQTKKAKVIVE